MSTYSLYDLTTGKFTGRVVDVPDTDLEANTPDGQAAMAGTFAPDQYVDTATGTVQSGGTPRAPEGFTAIKDVQTGDWHLIPTPVTLASCARSERLRRLTATDWIALRAWETSTSFPTNWKDYRQALRDLPNQPGWPDNITWPTEPATEP